MHTTWTEISRVQTRTAGAFIKTHQLFALFKSPKRRCQRTHVHRLCGDVQQVVQNTSDFRIKNTDQGRATGHFDTRQFFNRKAPRVLLVHGGHIIQPIKIRQVLQICAAFHQLFGTAVQQSNVRVAAFDNFTIQFQNQTQHAVCRRVLWTKVDVKVADLLFACLGVFETF